MPRSEQLRVALALVVGSAIGVLGSCTLPVDTKTGCFDSTDCNEARACAAGTCHDGACRFVCDHIRNSVGVCPGLSNPSDARFAGDCGGLDGLLSGVSEAACQSIWDRIHTSDDPSDECDVPLCATQCGEICGRGVACALIHDAVECKAGCMIQRPSCDEPIGSSCSDVPTEVLCYEARRRDAC